MGDHENGPAASRFAFQPFRDQAHILPVKTADWLIKNQYPAAGKDGAGNGKPLVPCIAFAFFCQSGIQQQLLRYLFVYFDYDIGA